MDLEERAKELQAQFPCEDLTLTQCRVATYHIDPCGWYWVGVFDGKIELARDELPESTRTIAINKQGCYK